ncbi:MAG TPA: translocation/assembly module TamB domain-containing protein, partial [Anaerolineae bacterium]|nr:translocation/assembly module TamB domain-containing protein [Anaerolineae bacterium]
NVAILQPLISDLQNLKGRVNAAFTIKGAVKDPALNGTLNVSDISFRPPLMNVPFTSGFAALRFDRDNIFLDSLSVGINKGKLLASGSASHNKSELSHLDVNAIIRNVSFERPKEYTMTIDSAHLSYKKHDNYYDLEGEVVLGESRLVKDFQPKAILPFIQKVERPAQAPSPVAQQVRINVLIRANQTLWVDNNLARMRVRSDIEMIGTLARPNVTGRMSVEEGYIVYLDKKFKIDHGIVDFIDPNRFNPIIDFQAGTNLKSYQTLSKIQYDITLTVNGPLEQATFELTSDPSLNKTDIIALLTVGATREQLTGRSTNGTDTSLSDILKERAEVLSSQKISGYFSRKVGNVLGLEEISVEGNLFTIGKSSGPQLVASEKISDRMGITYTTAVGHLNEQSIRLDYRLNKYFSLEGQTDQKGRSAIDLKYRLRFK